MFFEFLGEDIWFGILCDGGGVLRVVVGDGASVYWVTCFLVLVWLLVPVLRWQ